MTIKTSEYFSILQLHTILCIIEYLQSQRACLGHMTTPMGRAHSSAPQRHRQYSVTKNSAGTSGGHWED